MPKLLTLALAGSLSMITTTGIAANWKPLQGRFALTPEHYLDPPESERNDSHFRVELSGLSAKELFAAMKVPETSDLCTGAIQKRVGEIQCLFFKAKNHYECSFAIDVMRQTIEHGVTC